jgi:hypothetical protein
MACVSDEYNLCRAFASIWCAAVDTVWYATDTIFSLYLRVNRPPVGMNRSLVLEIGTIIDHLFL